MGVWETGEAGRRVSRSNDRWLTEYRSLLPDLREEDICGSPFAVASYRLHPELGEAEALVRFRDRLHRHGILLMLDFVPNHTAPDHPWVRDRPDYYVHGTEEELARRPQEFVQVDLPRRLGRPRPRPRPLLRRLARHPAARLRQCGRTGSDDRRAAEDSAMVRRAPVRYGDARPPGGIPADLGTGDGAVLAPRDRGGP
nr:alpha-amylase family glycosyl hydrolase [Methanoculleus sp.]